MSAHTVYRFFGRGDVLLYIGVTSIATHRMAQHIQDKRWFPLVERTTFEHYESRLMANRREREAIKSESPLFNDTYNRPPKRKRKVTPARREEGYTLVEAGKIANLSPNTLRAQIKNGVLPALLVGKTYLVRAKDLTIYIEKHKGNVGRPRKPAPPTPPGGGAARDAWQAPYSPIPQTALHADDKTQ